MNWKIATLPPISTLIYRLVSSGYQKTNWSLAPSPVVFIGLARVRYRRKLRYYKTAKYSSYASPIRQGVELGDLVPYDAVIEFELVILRNLTKRQNGLSDNILTGKNMRKNLRFGVSSF